LGQRASPVLLSVLRGRRSAAAPDTLIAVHPREEDRRGHRVRRTDRWRRSVWLGVRC